MIERDAVVAQVPGQRAIAALVVLEPRVMVIGERPGEIAHLCRKRLRQLDLCRLHRHILDIAGVAIAFVFGSDLADAKRTQLREQLRSGCLQRGFALCAPLSCHCGIVYLGIGHGSVLLSAIGGPGVALAHAPGTRRPAKSRSATPHPKPALAFQAAWSAVIAGPCPTIRARILPVSTPSPCGRNTRSWKAMISVKHPIALRLSIIPRSTPPNSSRFSPATRRRVRVRPRPRSTGAVVPRTAVSISCGVCGLETRKRARNAAAPSSLSVRPIMAVAPSGVTR